MSLQPTEKQTWFTWCSLCDDSGASSAALSLEDAAEEDAAAAADPFHLQLPCVNEAAAVVALEEQAMMTEVKDDDAARDVETGQVAGADAGSGSSPAVAPASLKMSKSG